MNRGGPNDPRGFPGPKSPPSKEKKGTPPHTHTHHEEPFRQRPAGLVSSHSKCFKDQLAVPPGSAAWLSAALSPGARPQPHALCPKVWRARSSGLHQNSAACSFPPTVAVAQEQAGGRGTVGGRAGPCQDLLDTNAAKRTLEAGEAARAPGNYFGAFA